MKNSTMWLYAQWVIPEKLYYVTDVIEVLIFDENWLYADHVVWIHRVMTYLKKNFARDIKNRTHKNDEETKCVLPLC